MKRNCLAASASEKPGEKTKGKQQVPSPKLRYTFDENKIRAVVNCREFENRQDVPGQFSYHHINVPDYGVLWRHFARVQ